MWPFGESEKKKILLKEYEEYAQQMLQPQIVQETEDVLLIKKVIEICQNKNGRLGCVVAVNWNSNWKAVQEINNDLSFSSKGVFWTAKDWNSFKPRRYALGLVLQSKRIPNSMKPTRQQVNAVGYKIIEIDTEYTPAMTFSEWKLFFRDWPSS